MCNYSGQLVKNWIVIHQEATKVYYSKTSAQQTGARFQGNEDKNPKICLSYGETLIIYLFPVFQITGTCDSSV